MKMENKLYSQTIKASLNAWKARLSIENNILCAIFCNIYIGFTLYLSDSSDR